MRIVVWLCGLTLLAIAGSYLVSLAARERSEAGRAAAISDTLFQGLQACDVPGLRERVIGRGDHKTAYVGEFRPVPSVGWVTSASKIFLYVLGGTGTVLIGNTSLPAQPGDFFQLPAGIRHAVRAKDGGLRTLYVEDEL